MVEAIKCHECGRDIDPFAEGYFSEYSPPPESALIATYCEKCYAEKRWVEVDEDTKLKWRRSVRALVASIKRIEDVEERKRVLAGLKRKVPRELEPEVPEE